MVQKIVILFVYRSNCNCPNCQEADRLGPAGTAFKPKVHNCHIPGCGKVYNKTSHLKAHLRWHSGKQNVAFCQMLFVCFSILKFENYLENWEKKI